MLISIAIPCYRSEKTLPMVVEEIKTEFAKHPEHDYQLVLVNDGSPDDTFGVIRSLCEKDPKIVGINLSRNFGQASARMAALPYLDGDIVVYMDDDGQHPARGIFQLADKMLEGYDVVCAKFTVKRCSWFKRVTSDLYARLMEACGLRPKGVTLTPFFAWSRLAIEELKKYHSPMPSVHSFMLQISTRFANVEMEQRERMAGQSGYSLYRMISLAIMNLTNFSIVPLRLSTFFGCITAGVGGITGIVLIIRKLVNPYIAIGYTSTMAVLLFVGGILMMMLGILGEYVGRIYMLLSNMPQYAIRETLNAEGGRKDKC